MRNADRITLYRVWPFQYPEHYIESIGEAPHLFDLVELNTAMARHLSEDSMNYRCECASISSQTMRNFWTALRSVVHGSFDKVSIFDTAELPWMLIFGRHQADSPALSQVGCIRTLGSTSPLHYFSTSAGSGHFPHYSPQAQRTSRATSLRSITN
jgi:hypothetical protein